MDSHVNVVVEGEAGSLARLASVLECLMQAPPAGELDEACELAWRGRLPGWLVSQFASEASAAESRAWLNGWRRASAAKRAEMEDEAGWELLDWLYWFSSDNEFWHLIDFSRSKDREMIVLLATADDCTPMKAIEWLVEKSGAEITSIDRRGDYL
ncbi:MULTISPECIES: hypothetical protein [Streptomyces]|nr:MULTISPECIES: hypothetical protein [Streptomyces]MYR00887.1 hypothetical protein [Streptomyces sp. SID6139]MYR03659.1 hypothetical protein [Streptomyces sp. SID6139]